MNSNKEKSTFFFSKECVEHLLFNEIRKDFPEEDTTEVIIEEEIRLCRKA